MGGATSGSAVSRRVSRSFTLESEAAGTDWRHCREGGSDDRLQAVSAAATELEGREPGQGHQQRAPDMQHEAAGVPPRSIPDAGQAAAASAASIGRAGGRESGWEAG